MGVIKQLQNFTSEDIKITSEQDVFFVSSAIHPYSKSSYTPKERLVQTLNTISSIHKYNENVYIIIMEATMLTENELSVLSPLCDCLVLFPQEQMSQLGKNNGEKFMSYQLAMRLINCSFRNMYKISGRYFLTDVFKTCNFSDTKITLRRAIWKPERLCMLTVLYCVPSCQFENYINALKNALFNRQFEDIEHGLFQSLQPNSYIEVPMIGASGQVAPEAVDAKLFVC